jgi:hypothetical protein
VRLIVSCLLAVGAWTASVDASPQTDPSASYELPSFAAELKRLAAVLEDASEADAVSIRQQLPPRWFVESRSDRFEVPTDWLMEALPASSESSAAWTTRRRRVRDRLLTLSGEASALATLPPEAASLMARQSLEEILKRREFEQGSAAFWRRRLERSLRDFFMRIAESLGLTPRAGRLTAVVLAWVAGLSALAGLGFWLARSLAQRGRSPHVALNRTGDRPMSSREWADRWSAALQAGDAREAIRCAYHSCLRRLEEQGVWRIDPARTAREYLPLLPARHDRQEAVADLTRQFERVWYGSQPLTSDGARQIAAHLESLGCLPGRQRAI